MAIFDIKNFYHSISISFNFSSLSMKLQISKKTLTNISKTDVFIMPCLKNFGKEDFDVAMGCFDGAEVCELVGSFMFTTLCSVLQKENVRLYCDDELTIVKQMQKEKEKRLLKYLQIMD